MRSEKDLHMAFSAWLRKQGIPYFHSRMDAKTSQACGDPDYICVFNGNCALVEFKWLKGKLSPAQKQRIEELETAGNAVCVAYDLQTAISHIESVFGSNAVLGHPGASGQALSEGGDEPCAEIGVTRQRQSSASNGAGQSNPEPAPKLWLAKSRDLGDVVVERNPQTGAMGFRRLAQAKLGDFTLPRWSEALG